MSSCWSGRPPHPAPPLRAFACRAQLRLCDGRPCGAKPACWSDCQRQSVSWLFSLTQMKSSRTRTASVNGKLSLSLSSPHRPLHEISRASEQASKCPEKPCLSWHLLELLLCAMFNLFNLKMGEQVANCGTMCTQQLVKSLGVSALFAPPNIANRSSNHRIMSHQTLCL